LRAEQIGAIQKNWCGIGAEYTPLTRETVENKGVLKYMKLGLCWFGASGDTGLFEKPSHIKA
jgi:hypothetical protein